MELIADLRYYPAADALQWAASSGFDGRLLFRRNRHALTVSLDGGRIVRCESNKELESLVQHLFAQGLVDSPDLAAAGQLSEPSRLGRTLVEMKVLTQSQLRQAVADHTLDLACSVIPWPDGIVSAQAAKLRPLTDPEPEPIEALFATIEAARRVDELQRIRMILPHDNIELEAGNAEEGEELAPAAQRLLETLRPGHTVGDLYGLIGGCKFSFLKRVRELIARGRLVRRHVGQAPEPAKESRTSLVDVVLDAHLDRRLRA